MKCLLYSKLVHWSSFPEHSHQLVVGNWVAEWVPVLLYSCRAKSFLIPQRPKYQAWWIWVSTLSKSWWRIIWGSFYLLRGAMAWFSSSMAKIIQYTVWNCRPSSLYDEVICSQSANREGWTLVHPLVVAKQILAKLFWIQVWWHSHGEKVAGPHGAQITLSWMS